MKNYIIYPILAVIIAIIIFGLVHHTDRITAAHKYSNTSALALIKKPNTAADKIVNGAKLQVIKGVRYDSSYVRISYPNGDVPENQGACTDVIIRSLRNAGFDLQKLVHEDMSRHFDLYPRKWGLTAPDSNIDHRRVPNHIVFMSRFAQTLPIETTGEAVRSWQPGDLIYWNLASSITHCGVISNVKGPRGLPLVIHNIGPSTSQEDCLDSWRIVGHFRYPRS